MLTHSQARRLLKDLFSKRAFTPQGIASILELDIRTIHNFCSGKSVLAAANIARLDTIIGHLDTQPQSFEQRSSLHPLDQFWIEHSNWKSDQKLRRLHWRSILLKNMSTKWPIQLPIGRLTYTEKIGLLYLVDFHLRQRLVQSSQKQAGHPVRISDKTQIGRIIRQRKDLRHSQLSPKSSARSSPNSA